MPAKIRYAGGELELPIGEFSIGRAGICSLALDDAMISRKHAILHVTADAYTLEDLGSRNGVLVNGMRIVVPTRLNNHDKILIGGHELTFVLEGDTRKLGATATTLGVSAAIARRPRQALSKGAFAVGSNLDLVRSREDTVVQNPVVTYAEKALALGRTEDAERVLLKLLNDMLAAAKAGTPIEHARVHEATTYALRLAESGKKSLWVDYVFELHLALNKVLSGADQERVNDVVRSIRYASSQVFRNYMQAIRKNAASMSPGEKFLLQRLYGLESFLGG